LVIWFGKRNVRNINTLHKPDQQAKMIWGNNRDVFGKLLGKNKQSGLVDTGDIITQRRNDGSWHVVKILAVDQLNDHSATAHCLTYQPVGRKPTLAVINRLEVFLHHSPVDAAEFSRGWQLVGNTPSTISELRGFAEYLKRTDFQRYATVTNQNIEALVAEANRYYQLGLSASQNRQHADAIECYSLAIEQFPLFFEAIDNRAFVHMDRGRYAKAIRDFQQSLQVNPSGVTAFFTMGECLMKLERYDEASQVFEAGFAKFPDKKPLFADYYKKAMALQQ